MKSKFTWIFTLFMVLAVQLVSAQEKTVTGTVTDADFGDPIPGVSVLLEGTQYGTETDMEGNYSINARQGQRLRFKFTNFEDVVMTVGQSDILNVTMAEGAAAEEITELVITSYRTVAKPKSTDAVSTVTSETIENRPNASFVQTLQAQVPGLNIATGSGQPGASNTTVLLRGLGSINGNTEPLFIIDGVPMGESVFRSINPNDIESISVLKDAGATAIYGNRGANGVIEVTTKRGSFEQDLTIKYVGSTGVSSLQSHNYNLMSGADLMRFEREAGAINWTDSEIENARNVDWLDMFFNEAISQSHNLSFSAGSKNLSSHTSIGYLEQDGILVNTDLKRFNFRTTLGGRNNDGRLRYNTSLSANFSRSNRASSLGTGGVNQNYVLGALKGSPYINPADADGGYETIWNSLFVPKFGNVDLLKAAPLLLLDKARWFNFSDDETKIIATGDISYDLPNGFNVGTRLGVDYTGITQSYFQDARAFNSWYFSNTNDPIAEGEYLGWADEGEQRRVSFNSTTHLTWNKVFNDKHELNVGAYVEYLKAHHRYLTLVQNGLDYYFSEPGAGTGWVGDTDEHDWYVPTVGLSTAQSGLFSYFGVADYDYDGKYGLKATLRRDASFRFADSNRWGTFWSVSGRWNISNEDFMSGSRSDLKLRASYGTTGNQDILGTGLFGGAGLFREAYVTSPSYNNSQSLILSRLANPYLQWETIEQANVGLDFGFFDQRIRGSVDVYQKTTKDLYQSMPISAINGGSAINANVGSMRNTGAELIVHGDVVKNQDWLVTLNFNGSYNKNEILELPVDGGIVWNGTSLTIMREGDPLGQYYLVEYAGVNPANGNLWFKDSNGDMTETPTNEDRRYTGKSYLPKYQGGFGIDASYKGFFLSAQFSYAQDLWRYDYDYAGFLAVDDIGTFNKTYDMLDYWTPTNTDAQFPSLTANNVFYENNSDRHLHDASYVRLRYAQFGYNFSKESLKFLKLSAARVYVQGENLHTWTKWKGFDAESNRPNDQNQYPTPRTVSFGVEVQF